jgi:hypothetical protein
MSGRALAAMWMLAGGIWLAGCKTDSLHRQPEAPPGPTTDLEQPAGIDFTDVRIVEQTEVDLVEQMVRYRAMYARYLVQLKEYYERNGMIDKLVWAEHELADLRQVKPYKYILAAEVPAEDLSPTESIPEADALFEEARQTMEEGGHGVPAVYHEGRMKEALSKFKELIVKYPSSDKIAESAYWCGYIHKEYFKGDELIAVRWFERAWQWDPYLQLPARFEAAVVYDFRLHERAKALELYRAVLEQENFSKSNRLFAADRMEQLTSEEESHLAPQEMQQVPGPTTRPGG